MNRIARYFAAERRPDACGGDDNPGFLRVRVLCEFGLTLGHTTEEGYQAVDAIIPRGESFLLLREGAEELVSAGIAEFAP